MLRTQEDLLAEVERGRNLLAGMKCFACRVDRTDANDKEHCGMAHVESWGHEWVSQRVLDLTSKMFRLGEALRSRTWLVWSIEHDAWWGPNHSGYYTNVDHAGRYSLEEAGRICRLRSPRPDGRKDEVLTPSPEWIEARDAAIAVDR